MTENTIPHSLGEEKKTYLTREGLILNGSLVVALLVALFTLDMTVAHISLTEKYQSDDAVAVVFEGGDFVE